MNRKKLYYGWPLVGVGFLVYGFGIAPAYYSWGFLAPELMRDIGLTREQVGSMFGAFTLMYAVVSPLAAAAMGRFGLRGVVTAGSLISAFGFWMVGRAESATDLYWSYAFVGGLGLGLSTVLPAQTIPIFWFRRFRARATAIILMGAGVVGAIVTPVADVILEHWGWRSAWTVIAGISVGVALLGALFLRNRPEDIGQLPDGREPDTPTPERGSLHETAEAAGWTASRAIRTPQFAIATFAALVNALPWRVFTAHGRLHFEDLGFVPTLAAAILGVRVGVSALGRLSGSLGDFLPPNRVQGIALSVSGLGLAGLLFAETPLQAYACVTLMGFGFGAGYVSVSVVFAYFFGQRAFLGSNGLQIAIIGVAGWIGPTWAGAAADQTGNYTGTFAVLTALCFSGAVAI
ncbi:MAG: MFS transporter, partial [Gammaproteobacteria bacterium]|nr:MFS transporter [Gammaproteobacteria bacterium]